ncbi:uncharacterized protein EI97DRAFT_428609 [Westerdykella ornata]|uniref:Transcription factor domain-containing protein n=1 Tax=Westerdykella ornata TaxID=318751 RepID=A0A6A6J543_WESOR|nr:uncharacterized protein EI97DRAFT_428609 [Westerdykella ornata]KAF2271243.1 hypothetical protein EI97DRAFT_428609 [Westerdykella ornata]
MATAFEFVVLDPVSNLKPGKSLRIRSRCMQGKNKREGSRRTQREEKRLAKGGNVAAAKTKDPTTPVVSLPVSSISHLSFVRFAAPDIDSEAKGLLFKAFAYNVANQALSPLDRCVNFDCVDSAFFEWLFSDATFLHSILCASYAINELMVTQWNGKPGRKTVFHLRETLSLLRAKMRQEDAYRDESVLHIVINLALLAAVFGDWEAAAAHLKGLRKIVQLRGDLAFLRARPKLHFKLDRLDLAWSLSSGQMPFFLHPTVSWEPLIPPPYSLLPPGRFRPSPDWDSRLVNVFLDFQYLSLRINHSVCVHARYHAGSFQRLLTSLQSLLLALDGSLQSPIEELVRLTMLAFLATTFKVPGRRIPYGWVVDQLGRTYVKVTPGIVEQDRRLGLWVLIIAALTAANAHDWVRGAWEIVSPGLDWVAVKNYLMQVMWIESIHDKPGQMVFKELERLEII